MNKEWRDELITKGVAFDALTEIENQYEFEDGHDHLMSWAKTKIMVLPSAQRIKGRWVDKSGGIEGAWNYCSVCGEQAIDLYDFCPNCGADMRGGQDE